MVLLECFCFYVSSVETFPFSKFQRCFRHFCQKEERNLHFSIVSVASFCQIVENTPCSSSLFQVDHGRWLLLVATIIKDESVEQTIYQLIATNRKGWDLISGSTLGIFKIRSILTLMVLEFFFLTQTEALSLCERVCPERHEERNCASMLCFSHSWLQVIFVEFSVGANKIYR